MSGLANLARLVEAATPGPWKVVPARDYSGADMAPWPMIVTADKDPLRSTSVCEFGFDRSDENAALIVNAPDLAALLIECHYVLCALSKGLRGHPGFPVTEGHVKDLLSRLAGFDAQLGDRQ